MLHQPLHGKISAQQLSKNNDIIKNRFINAGQLGVDMTENEEKSKQHSIKWTKLKVSKKEAK